MVLVGNLVDIWVVDIANNNFVRTEIDVNHSTTRQKYHHRIVVFALCANLHPLDFGYIMK